MTRFIVSIETDNLAPEDQHGQIAAILRDLADQIDHSIKSYWPLHNAQGSQCGHART